MRSHLLVLHEQMPERSGATVPLLFNRMGGLASGTGRERMDGALMPGTLGQHGRDGLPCRFCLQSLIHPSSNPSLKSEVPDCKAPIRAPSGGQRQLSF